MADYTIGIDVSQYQGSMRWNTAVEAGVKFVYVRASIGSEVDEQFERNARLLPTKGIHFGFYFPHVPTIPWQEQAETFCDLVEDVPWDLPPAIDVELAGDQSRLADVVLHVNLRLKVPPTIYTTGLFWNTYVGDVPWAPLLPLWIALWNDDWDHPWQNDFYRPVSWEDWDFWQWSGDGNGRGAEFGARSEDVPLDRFNGDEAALDRFATRVRLTRKGRELGLRITDLERQVLELMRTVQGLRVNMDGDIGGPRGANSVAAAHTLRAR